MLFAAAMSLSSWFDGSRSGVLSLFTAALQVACAILSYRAFRAAKG
jgi:hypothetical protein